MKLKACGSLLSALLSSSDLLAPIQALLANYTAGNNLPFFLFTFLHTLHLQEMGEEITPGTL